MVFELFMMAISLVFIAIIIHSIRKNRAFRHVAVRTQGVVVSRDRHRTNRTTYGGGSSIGGSTHSTGSSSSSGSVTILGIRFRTVDGREVVGSAEMGGLGAPKRGDTVQILYDPNDTSKATVDTALGRGTCWHLPGLVVFAAMFVIAAVQLIRTLTG